MLIRSLTAGLLLAGLAFPQDSSTQTFRTGINVVVAPTVVTNKAGEYVNGLQPYDFQLTDNGKLQDIKVDVTYVPISLVVAIQANASVDAILTQIRKVGPLFKALVTGEQGEVAIVAFDHRFQVLQDFTSDTSKIEEALQKLRAGSSTSAMTDAVISSARMLNGRPKDRRRVLMIVSEDRDYGSKAKAREALDTLQLDNISVYSVDISRLVTSVLEKPQPQRPNPIPATAQPLPAGVPPTPQNAEQVYGNQMNSGNFIPAFVGIFKEVKSIFVSNPVTLYTKFTGGKQTSFKTQRDLERAISSIGAELHSEYLITYTPNNKQEGGFHQIEVAVDRHEAKVRTRPGYWIASQF